MVQMKPRWMIERKKVNHELEELVIIEIYAPGEKKELVKKENKDWSHKRELIILE